MEIRPAVEDDLPALLPLMRAYCTFYGRSPSDAALEQMARVFLAEPDREGRQFVAVGELGGLLGYATLLWSWDTTLGDRVAVMEDLFVEAAARGQGVGRALIGVVREAATDAAVADLVWETAPDNTTAQALYDTTGAVRSSWYAYRMPAKATPTPTPTGA